LGLGEDFKARINELDNDYVSHVGTENVIRQMIEKNFENNSEQLELTILLQKIGFSQTGSEELVFFIDESVTHYLLWNWIELFLEVKFSRGLPISCSGFPYQHNEENKHFFLSLNTDVYENSQRLMAYNFTSSVDFQNWITNQNDRFRLKLEESKVSIKNIFVLVFLSSCTETLNCQTCQQLLLMLYDQNFYQF
jgi:hypothetical protein